MLVYQTTAHQFPKQTAAVVITHVLSAASGGTAQLVSASQQQTNHKTFSLALSTHLAHLELEEASLLLHLLGDFSPRDLGADHSVLLGVLALLFLDLCTGEREMEEAAEATPTVSLHVIEPVPVRCRVRCEEPGGANTVLPVYLQLCLVVLPGLVEGLLYVLQTREGRPEVRYLDGRTECQKIPPSALNLCPGRTAGRPRPSSYTPHPIPQHTPTHTHQKVHDPVIRRWPQAQH